MCGRYTQILSWSDLVELYRITVDTPGRNIQASYNVAPTQSVPIVRRAQGTGERELALVRWGLVPFWAKDVKVGYSLINARAESVETKASFREAFAKRRCLVPASGFYEWRAGAGKVKQPFYITRPDRRPLAFAGLWESWQGPAGECIESCAIVVGEANAQLWPVHDRMPVILDAEAAEAWLDRQRPPAEAKPLLRPYAGDLAITPVGRGVNSAGNDDPSLIEPLKTFLL